MIGNATDTNGTCKCSKCGGSGKYHSRKVVNGRSTVEIGDCYACQGKGQQTPSDVARNRTYWRHNVARLAGF